MLPEPMGEPWGESWGEIESGSSKHSTLGVKFGKGFGIGFGKVGLPLRLALTATINSPSIDLVCEIIGKEVTLLRLDNFMKRIKS